MFGIPMIGNNIPGLYYNIQNNQMGYCCDNKVDEIKRAIIKIDDNYSFFSDNSRIFYDTTDNNKNFSDILEYISEKIESRRCKSK